MIRSYIIRLGMLVMLHCERADAEPFDVGNRSQLFIDRVLVASAENVEFKLHPATKHSFGPWLRGDDKQGPVGTMVLYDRDEKRFKSWSSAAYNTSPDGLHWSEPEPNGDDWRHILRAQVIKDEYDVDPARRYKLVTFAPPTAFPPGIADADKVTLPDGTETIFWYAKGYNTYVSPDGRKLTHLSPGSIVKNELGRAPGDMLNAFFDERNGRYVALVKAPTQETKFTKRRSFGVTTSADFEHWTAAKLVLVPDQQDDDGARARLDDVRPLLMRATETDRVRTDIYGVGGPYQQESCVISFPWLLTINDSKSDGPSEVQLAVTRDLKHWARPFREAAIPRGRVALDQPGGSDDAYAQSDWDSCWFNSVGPAVDVGDEVWAYYHACNTPHNHPATFSGSRIPKDDRWKFGPVYKNGRGIAVWKRDRFVSVDAAAGGGTLVTVPLTLAGNRLELNASTRPEGRIVVELCDASGTRLALSKPIAGDDLRHPVAWESPLNLANLANSAVTLRFLITDAELFAFAFRDGS